MKAMSYTLSVMLTMLGLGLFAAPTVSANCDNYGNQVNIGSSDNCEVNQNYCDGESGPAGSGAGAGAGIGANTAGGEAEASASAGSSTHCGDQCAGSSCSQNGTSGEPEVPGRDAYDLPACKGSYATLLLLATARSVLLASDSNSGFQLCEGPSNGGINDQPGLYAKPGIYAEPKSWHLSDSSA